MEIQKSFGGKSVVHPSCTGEELVKPSLYCVNVVKAGESDRFWVSVSECIGSLSDLLIRSVQESFSSFTYNHLRFVRDDVSRKI